MLHLILSDKVQELLDNFAEVLEVRVTFFDLSGRILRRGLKMRNCDYCRLVQDEPGGFDRCAAMDAAMRTEAMRRRKLIAYTCHAGLEEVIAPVHIDGEAAGFLMVGQFRTGAKPRLPEWAAAESGELRGRLEAAFARLPLIGPEKLAGVIGLFSMLLDYLAARELAAVTGDRLKAEVEAYIDGRLRETVRLPAAARRLGRSVSAVTHELKSRYNTSFSRLLIERRIARAEELMMRHPEQTVAEISLQVGVDDPYYFSRFYRKYRGYPPTEFRRRAKSANEGAQEGGGENQPGNGQFGA